VRLRRARVCASEGPRASRLRAHGADSPTTTLFTTKNSTQGVWCVAPACRKRFTKIAARYDSNRQVSSDTETTGCRRSVDTTERRSPLLCSRRVGVLSLDKALDVHGSLLAPRKRGSSSSDGAVKPAGGTVTAGLVGSLCARARPGSIACAATRLSAAWFRVCESRPWHSLKGCCSRYRHNRAHRE
jgi:hypothetical protein